MLNPFSFKHLASLSLPIVMASLPFTALAEDGPFDFEVRGSILLGDGVPSNDMLGAGIAGRYELEDGWFVSAAIEAYDFDFERPIEVVGLRQDPVVKAIDGNTSSTVLSAALGRNYHFDSEKFDWFWELGLGAGFPDVTGVTGPLSTGGDYTVVTDAGTELHLLSKLGVSYYFASNWSLNFVARLEHHFIDYKVTETETGATGSISSQTPAGTHLAIRYSF